MPSPELQSIVQALRAVPDRAQTSLLELRQQMEQQAAPVPSEVTVRPVQAGGVPAEWVLAPGAQPVPRGAGGRALVYFHGGGYYRGSVNTHREFVSRLSRACGVAGLTVDYRLAPEHPFPAAVDDALAAYRWVVRGGTPPGRIVLAGDSAGGGLVAAVLLELKRAGETLPAGGVLLSPWMDLDQSGASMQANAHCDPTISKPYLDRFAQAYLAGADARHPQASPLHGDMAGLPPLLIQVGTVETLLDDSTRFAAKAQAAGVDARLERWEEMFHVWQRYAPQLPEARQAIEHVGAFVKERLGLNR